MTSILIRNPLLCCRMAEDCHRPDLLNAFSGGHVYLEGNKIISAGPEPFTGDADQEIDASRLLVLPGLINTHHHFFQTLTRNLLATQKAGLFDWLIAHYDIWRSISAEAFYVSAKTAIAELLLSGCTTTSDHLYLFPQAAGTTLIDREIDAARELGIRFQPTRGSMSLGKTNGGLPPDDVTQSEDQIQADIQRLLKAYHDDSPGAMLRMALAPCSPFSVTPELMRRTVRLAREYNLQIHTHLAETRDEETFCLRQYGQRPFEYMRSLGWINPCAWFAHAIWLNDDEIRQAGAAPVGIAHCPSSNLRLGSGIARIREMLDAGVSVGLGVDGSASNDSSNLLLELRNAMLLSRLRVPEYWLSTEDVLWMATVGGARALGRNDIGQIRPGYSADLTLISMERLEYAGGQHDPAAAIVFGAALRPVDWVIINGQVIVMNGRINGLDEQQLVARHQQLSDQLIDHAGAARRIR